MADEQDTSGANIDPAFRAGMEEGVGTALAERVTALEEELAAVKADRDSQGQRADAAEAAVAKAKAKVTRDAAPKKARKLDPDMEGVTGDDLKAAIAQADADGKPVEVVFSDGKKEILGIPPATIVGEVWKPHALGMMLADPVCVTGPAAGAASVAIQGYALLIDGKQIAYCKRSDPINVAPGSKITIADDIYF